jgi:phage anti-repressor protein
MSKLSLKDFLKLYTTIPVKFINEYYEFYELCKNNKFGIDAYTVLEYLNITDTSSFYRRLRSNYKLNYDYVIVKLNQKLVKGQQDTFYYISFDTFEKICMNSTSKKGEQFRDYFIMLRKFIDYYRNHISDKIIDLTSNKKYIYILGINKKKNIFKVGRTKNIRKRLYTYATGLEKHPDIMYILIVDNPKDVENCVKIFTDKYKNNKEQYKIDYDILKQTVFDCAQIDKNIVDNVSNKEVDTYLVYDDSKSIKYINLDRETIGYDTNFIMNKPSKKPINKPSKKPINKPSKKLNKKPSKKPINKSSKK